MAHICNIPQEILHDIISYLNRDHADLRSCSLTCRALWNVATAALYRDIDLSFASGHIPRDSRAEKLQLMLLQTLASNPTLAEHVRYFKNDDEECQEDVVTDVNTDTSLITAAAKHVTQLTRGFFDYNPFAMQIIANIQSYPLQDLTVQYLDPERFIWKRAPTTLRKLTWSFEVEYRQDPWEGIQFLINVVEATCPELESLDITALRRKGRYMRPGRLLETPPEVSEDYKEIQSSEIRLSHLRHIRCRDLSCSEEVSTVDIGFLDLFTKYSHQLSSIGSPVGVSHGSISAFEHILQLCNLNPNIKTIEVAPRVQWVSDPTGLQFMTTLSSHPSIRNVEHLSILNTYTPFSSELGRLLTTFPHLKVLRIGDPENTKGPFGDDGRLECEEYAPHILAFIATLPPSLKELYLEINAENLDYDDDDDFSPLAILGPAIFSSLPRLHTCDIHAWSTDRDGGQGHVPRKAAFYRRLPGARANVKMIWTSRMDMIYQSDYINVRKACEEVEGPAEGFWKGEDATEVWCGGFEYQQRNWSRPAGWSEMDGSPMYWPFFKDLIRSYEMFQRREGP